MHHLAKHPARRALRTHRLRQTVLPVRISFAASATTRSVRPLVNPAPSQADRDRQLKRRLSARYLINLRLSSPEEVSAAGLMSSAATPVNVTGGQCCAIAAIKGVCHCCSFVIGGVDMVGGVPKVC